MGVDRISVESSDGTRLHVAVFRSDRPVASLVVVHGLQSHAGWLEATGTGEHLARHGIETWAFDRRGSGRSEGRRGDASRPEVFLDDLDAVRARVDIDLAEAGAHTRPVHVLANCFGTRVVLPYVARHPDRFASITLTSPATHMSRKGDYSLLEKLRILTSRGERRFATPLEDRDFVRAGEWLEWIGRDELSLRDCTAAFLRAAARLTTRMRSAVGTSSTPMLVLLAEDDVLVRNEAIEADFTARYRGVLRIERLPGDHYMDFTPARAAFRTLLVDWLLSGAAGSPGS